MDCTDVLIFFSYNPFHTFFEKKICTNPYFTRRKIGNTDFWKINVAALEMTKLIHNANNAVYMNFSGSQENASWIAIKETSF